MEMIILDDGVFKLVSVTREMLKEVKLYDWESIDCFDLCDIIRTVFTTYLDTINKHFMNDGSGYFYGCICR
jgi:hypothetical protein